MRPVQATSDFRCKKKYSSPGELIYDKFFRPARAPQRS